jgi:hypothetical protein
MIPALNDMDESKETQANVLCQSCGLCCTGHLFIWAKLRPAELDSAEALGLTVFRTDPAQRGFSQPCPLWKGDCTIYDSPQYPRVCRAYQCKLLKDVMAEETSLADALARIGEAKSLIGEVQAILPPSSTPNFRERLVAELESPSGAAVRLPPFRPRAEALLTFYEQVFGVDDLIENGDEDGSRAW